MAGSTLIAKTTLCLILHFGFLTASHYTDDSDYGDFDYYKDLPEKRMPGYKFQQDDFYIASGPEDTEDRSRRVVNKEGMENPVGDVHSREEANARGKGPSVERVYLYTKHRIPGYDYDEFDFMSRKLQRCNERSVWTHCLCQFTCTEPNIVDCYTPCTSGCECREDFVYDERTQQCVLPENCQPIDDYLLY